MTTTRRASILRRFRAKVTIPDDPDGCWEWTAGLGGKKGYGRFGVKHPDGAWRPRTAHRLAYEWLEGPIPDGMQIHHECGNKQCVNPAHLAVVTLVENVLMPDGGPARNAAKTHCPRGHEYTPENTRLDRLGRRYCNACQREVHAPRWSRRRRRR